MGDIISISHLRKWKLKVVKHFAQVHTHFVIKLKTFFFKLKTLISQALYSKTYTEFSCPADKALWRTPQGKAESHIELHTQSL